jgi:arginine decarboxylase
VVRLRSDLWNRTRDAARRLARGSSRHEAESLQGTVRVLLVQLAAIEPYFAFPGTGAVAWLQALHETDPPAFADAVARIGRILNGGLHRRIDLASARMSSFMDLLRSDHRSFQAGRRDSRPYFEVLVVDEGPVADFVALQHGLRALRAADDRFTYEAIRVTSAEDALVAVLANPDIQAVVARFGLPLESRTASQVWLVAIYRMLRITPEAMSVLRPGQRTNELGRLLAQLRPELDLYRVTDAPVETVVGAASEAFRRVFYQSEDHQDLHVSILHGVTERYTTPFFDALRLYAERPTGMFHALPISRGRTVAKSNWIGDFGAFYGNRLFMAETSATTGGLDSLLQPTGSLKDAQSLAARAFGSARTYFVTNGTSTANKIVVQALVRPADIVMMGRDCHKSHPYATILSGAYPIVLDGYPLRSLSMYGGVPLRTIVERLVLLREKGQLARVRVLLLTNLTFDGITYDPYRVMRTVLAIHPDITFLWDEAWFAYGQCSPLLRSRTAMAAARRLDDDFSAPGYAADAKSWREAHPSPTVDELLNSPAYPEPGAAVVRVYATHSTHKTLTALRQGSMIHVFDRDFERRVEEPFYEAYMTHTSTSPNYQILASLDVGRRQVELEGYRLVGESIDLAMVLRERIRTDPLLSRYFGVLGPAEMVPDDLRPSGIETYDRPGASIESAWRTDEFVLDPTRVTLHVGRTGHNGDGFKTLLMDEYAIHINKTSRNSVLFLIHIGAARGTLAHLVKVLTDIATNCERWLDHATAADAERFHARVRSLTEGLPPLPDFSAFHPSFVPDDLAGTGAGDMRRAYFLAYDPDLTEHLPIEDTLDRVAASLVTPYPPGFPVLVPGQIVSKAILDYLLVLDTQEVHGLHPEFGMRVFHEEALQLESENSTHKKDSK